MSNIVDIKGKSEIIKELEVLTNLAKEEKLIGITGVLEMADGSFDYSIISDYDNYLSLVGAIEILKASIVNIDPNDDEGGED